MGLIEWLTGWKYVGNTLHSTLNSEELKIHPNIIKILNNKVNKNIFYQSRKWFRENKGRAPLGRTIRGVKNLPNFTGVGYVKGKTFLYKGKETNYYIDNQGHGGGVSQGMDIWRKLRTDRR